MTELATTTNDNQTERGAQTSVKTIATAKRQSPTPSRTKRRVKLTEAERNTLRSLPTNWWEDIA